MSSDYRKPRKRRKTTGDPINRATIGSHVIRGVPKKDADGHSGPAFSPSRKTARARRGMVDQVMPQTTSVESASEHSRRVARMDYELVLRRKSRVKTLVIALLSLMLVGGIVAAVGMFVFGNSISDKVALSDPATKAALLAPEETDDASYTLIVGEYYQPGQSYEGPELLILARLDKKTQQITLLSIPSNTQVYLKDGKVGKICESQLRGGDAALIEAVSSFTGVKINHFVKSDKDNFTQLVDALGGLEFDVTEEVDDPTAGSIYISAGTQNLNGEQAVTLSRATNFSTGTQMQSENQCRLVVALGKELVSAQGLDLFTQLDGIADHLETDCDYNTIQGLVDGFRGIEDSNIYIARIPGYSTTSPQNNIKYFVPDKESLAAMMALMQAGQNPVESSTNVAQVDPASFDITVRNGSGVTGGATQVADLLTTRGYHIKETGNTDQYVYDQTLVIYKDDAMYDAAQSLVSSLGVGRTVAAGEFYSFDSGILVVVGKDWKPLN